MPGCFGSSGAKPPGSWIKTGPVATSRVYAAAPIPAMRGQAAVAWCEDDGLARNMAKGDDGPGMLAVVLEADTTLGSRRGSSGSRKQGSGEEPLGAKATH
jgi:hypothetical protein